MSITDKTTLKSKFKRGDKPLQVDFANWMDSYRHKNDQIPVSSVEKLREILDGKTDKSETELYKALKRIVTAVHTHEELLKYPVYELIAGDGIIVARDEARDGKTNLYVLQADKTWRFHISWITEDALKGVDHAIDRLTEEQLESGYGNKGVGFELWCDKALIKYTKISEYYDEVNERISLWHQFNYVKPDNFDPQPEEFDFTAKDAGIDGRYLATDGNELYALGCHLHAFDGIVWNKLFEMNNNIGDATAIDCFKGGVYFANNHMLRKYEAGTVSSVLYINPHGEIAPGQDWWSICCNETDLFVGGEQHSELGVRILNEAGTGLNSTNLGYYSSHWGERNKCESYRVITAGQIVWAGSTLLRGMYSINDGLWYWDKAERKFIVTNLVSGNYGGVAEFNGYYYAFGESGEGIFKAPVGTYNFTQIKNSGSFNAATVIDDKLYACGKDGLYVITENDEISKIFDVSTYKVIKFKGSIFICHYNGVSFYTLGKNEVKSIVDVPGSYCRDAVIYRDNLYAGFDRNSNIKIIEVQQ